MQLTNETLENELAKDSFKSSFLDCVSTVTLPVVGGFVGAAFGMMGGSKYTAVGFAAGAEVATLVGKKIRDDNCNQQYKATLCS